MGYMKRFFHTPTIGFLRSLWRTGRLGILLLVVSCIVGLLGCSSVKNVFKSKQTSTPFDNALISSGQDEVRKKLGDPNVVSKTLDDHILWVYLPTWKIIPNDKGTLYVEFADGKVVKIFQKR